MNTEAFFKELSQRLYKENDLSDITWAFANSDQSFKIIFMKFFFPDFGDNGEVALDLVREYSKEDSRPDLYMKSDLHEYIIEVKIYDRSHHFEQYIKAFPNAKRGYIANYSLPKNDGFVTKTWQEFYNYLLTLDKNSGINLESLSLYIHYLKSTCSLMELELVKLNGLPTLLSLDKIISIVISKCDTEYDYIGQYPSSLNKTNKRYGSYYELKNKKTKKNIWIWVGVYFSETVIENSRTIIYTEINEKWCVDEFNFLKNYKWEVDESMKFDAPFFDKEITPSYTFRMKNKHFVEFTSAHTITEQENILKDYIENVLSFISK